MEDIILKKENLENCLLNFPLILVQSAHCFSQQFTEMVNLLNQKSEFHFQQSVDWGLYKPILYFMTSSQYL